MRSRSRLVVTAVAIGALVAACASPPELDTAAVSRLVETSLVDATGVTPTDVDCPRLPEIDDGTTFECTATLDAQELRVAGVVIDARAGVVEVSNADAVLFVELLEGMIAFELFEQLERVLELDCGDSEVLVVPPGDTLTCTATDRDGDSADVRVEVLDTSGQITFSLG